MMSLARPKSQIFTSLPSQINTFLAARSRWTHCRETQLNIVSTPETSCCSCIKAKVMVELFW